MENLENTTGTILQSLKQIGFAVAAILTSIELWLRDQLQHFGVPHQFQTVILLAAAVVLILGALKLFGGLIRLAIVLMLLVIAIHIMLPIISR